MTTVKIGIIGFGTVGAGVAECLFKNGDVLARRIGTAAELHKIADLDIVTDRGVDVPKSLLSTNVDDVFNTCDIIVELIGGKTVAKAFIIRALEMGKSVITANKALLAECGDELFAIAEAHDANIYYEASVGGGIPIIKAVRESFAGNRFQQIHAILNGTCNYILTRMDEDGLDFQQALDEAKAKGYAEANPSLDTDGIDTAHKTAILASLAYGKWFGLEKLHIEGISELKAADLRYARDLGYKVKLLGIIRQLDGNVEFRVHPALIPAGKTLANVNDVYNAVEVTGDYVGDILMSGRGAGRNATASAVVADVADAVLDLSAGSHRRIPSFRQAPQFAELIDMKDVRTRHYLRMCCRDHVGAYAEITQILAKHQVSISGIVQREPLDSCVNVLLLTHLARESDVQMAINELNALPDTLEKIVHIRIEVW